MYTEGGNQEKGEGERDPGEPNQREQILSNFRQNQQCNLPQVGR
jgi:hypothetical protein